MPKVKGTIKISYEWRELNGGSTNIQENHVQALHESAEEQIREAFDKRDCYGGQLKDNVHMNDDDPEDGIDYFGSWKVEISKE